MQLSSKGVLKKAFIKSNNVLIFFEDFNLEKEMLVSDINGKIVCKHKTTQSEFLIPNLVSNSAYFIKINYPKLNQILHLKHIAK